MNPLSFYTDSECLVRHFFDLPVCRGIGVQGVAGTVLQETPFLDLAACLPYPVLVSTIFTVTAHTSDFEGSLTYDDYISITSFGVTPLGLSAFPIASNALPVRKTVNYLRFRNHDTSWLEESLSFHDFMDLHDRACRQCLADLMEWCPPMALTAAGWSIPRCINIMAGAPDALLDWVDSGYVQGPPGTRWWCHIYDTGVRRVVSHCPWCPSLVARIVRRFESLDLINHGFTLVLIVSMDSARRANRLVDCPVFANLNHDGRTRLQMGAVVAPRLEAVVTPAGWVRCLDQEEEREPRTRRRRGRRSGALQ